MPFPQLGGIKPTSKHINMPNVKYEVSVYWFVKLPNPIHEYTVDFNLYIGIRDNTLQSQAVNSPQKFSVPGAL